VLQSLLHTLLSNLLVVVIYYFPPLSNMIASSKMMIVIRHALRTSSMDENKCARIRLS
jgi:hypothetical protein